MVFFAGAAPMKVELLKSNHFGFWNLAHWIDPTGLPEPKSDSEASSESHDSRRELELLEQLPPPAAHW